MRNNVVPEDFEAYLKLNYKVIPVGESLKSQGKRPLVENYLDLPWEDYDDPMDLVNHWFSRLGDKITGLGLVLGPTSNNICCIDIDTEDGVLYCRTKELDVIELFDWEVKLIK